MYEGSCVGGTHVKKVWTDRGCLDDSIMIFKCKGNQVLDLVSA